MSRVWRFIGAAIVVGGYFILAAPVGYLAFAIWTAFPTRNPRRRARALQNVMRAGFGFMHVLLRWMHILHYRRSSLEGTIPETPCILVANHPTLVDISSMIATVPHIVFPVKSSLYRSFWARPLLQAADQFEGAPRDAPLAIQRVVDEAATRLDQGYRVIIFPEGTRSPADGRLHPFGRMAFELAVRRNVPIIPLVITCEPRWLTREKSFFDYVPSTPRLRIRALDPIHSEGSSSRTLRDIVKARIESELKRSRQDEGLASGGSVRGSDVPERMLGPEVDDRGIHRVDSSDTGSSTPPAEGPDARIA